MIRKAIIIVLTLAAVGTSLDAALGLAPRGCYWDCPPVTWAAWTYDFRVSYGRGELRASFARQTGWVPWTLTPQWSCSSHVAYADVSYAMLSSDPDIWNSCKQWHFQPNLEITRTRFPGFHFRGERGRENFKGSTPGYPPTFVSKRDHDNVQVAFWATALLFAAYPILVLIKTVFRRLRPRPGFCSKCAYNLTGLSEPRCPECGTEFDPSNLRSPPG